MSQIRQTDKQDCQRCGTCCLKGGPVLHDVDRELLDAGHITQGNLITIRKGEQVFSPISGKVESAAFEMLKMQGQGGNWTCSLYNAAEKICRLYDHRPLECRLLKCWAPSDLEAIIGRQLLSRYDFIPPDSPLRRLIDIHERECSCTMLSTLCAKFGLGQDELLLEEITQLIKRDVLLRLIALKELGLEERFEFFVLGRPLFKQLTPYGIRVYEQGDDLCLARDLDAAQ